MQIDDLTVEVRDATLARVGQILPADLVGLSAVMRYNKVGGWALTLRADHPLVGTLRAPGGGIIITGPSGVLLSGPTIRAKRKQSAADPIGVWELEGADDSLLLAERLAYPTPSALATAQTTAYDVRTGAAETVAKAYVNANLGPGAIASRQVSGLTIETDLGRGLSVTERARFDTLGELLERVVATSGLGFEIEQSGSGLVFKVYQPTDRSATIRMDVENERLTSAEYAYERPGATHVHVAGQGEGAARTIVLRENAASATTWGRRVELFKDQRDTNATAELQQAGDEILAEKGSTIESISVTPSDDETMLYAIDWGLGDRVTVVVGGSEISSVVTEAALVVTENGVKIGATVGNPEAAAAVREPEAAVAATQAEQGERISNLERNAEGGMPAGAVTAWAGASSPAGWLLCDGTSYSPSAYPALFAAIGTSYGGTTSAPLLPNLKGRVPVGRDAAQTEFDLLGESGGAKTHTLTVNEMPSHTHTQNAHSHTQDAHNHSQNAHSHTQNAHSHGQNVSANAGSVPGRRDYAGEGPFQGPYSQGISTDPATATNQSTTATNIAATATNQSTTATNQNTGGGAAHNNLQPYLVLNYIIKT